MHEDIFWYYDGLEWIEKRGIIAMILAKRLGYLVAVAKD
jgi:hypothetical protein